ncbi:unnamed protein product [Macrosiphum euphorbiae]|uniref:Uncharacterized protein n=1 Tax=Macrosiphum euphorbiae TaxID=13131 RepID=A0AAV0VTY6_9HEMI|nr:unnamed protein product [Macrosiphum euphorbiae]
MLVSPVDNNAGGSCRGKQNNNQQCSLPRQKSECSVSNVREPLLANLEISFDEEPEADFCKNDTYAESDDREATGCCRIAKNDTCSTESDDREATGGNTIAKNGDCGARPREESCKPAKEPTRADASRDDPKNVCCRQPTFDDQQQKGAGSSRRNNKPWMGCESLLQVSTPTEADFCKNDTCTESNDREATGCSRIAKNGDCGAGPREESCRPAKEPTRADESRDDLKKTSCCRQPTFDVEQQKGVGLSRRNNEPWTGHESLQVSTPTVRPYKDPTTDKISAPPPKSNNRTVTNRSDGVLQEFEKELSRVEQRRAQLMRCIERKQRALMKENREGRTSIQTYCEQQGSGGEKQPLHDTRDRQPPQQDTRERRQPQYDTSKRQPSQHNTSECRPSQYDTTAHRPSQYDTNNRRPSEYEMRERRSSHHDSRKRRPSQDDTRKRRPSQDDTRKRRPSQHDTRKRRPSQDDTRKRRPSQDDTRKRRPSQDDTRKRRSSQHDTRERQSLKGENRKQPQGGSFAFECFCNFIKKDNSFNTGSATKQVQRNESYQPSARGVSDGNSFCPKQVSSRHNNNNNAYNNTGMEVGRKDATSTGRHDGSGRRSTPRNDATGTSSDFAEQNRSRQDSFQPRGCPRIRVVDLISFINNSSVTSIGGTQKRNNRGWNETQ